jgi:hypothetical protein
MLLVLAITATALVGCRQAAPRKKDAARPPAPSAAPGAGITARSPSFGPAFAGVKVEGPGPTFSWSRMPGAALYAVMVTGGGGDMWMWTGTETSVLYGVADGDQPADLAPLSVGPRRQYKQPKPGKTYRYTITALDGQGKLLALSGQGTFQR